MNKVKGILMGILFFSSFLHSQVKITGKVIDHESGEPLPFVNVVLKGTLIGASSQISGNFTLSIPEDIKPPYSITFSILGYESFDTTVSGDVSDMIISLKSKAIVMKEVVVSGTRVQERAVETPASIQKISEKAIANAASGDFYEEMNTQKDVSINQGSLGFKSPNIRGFNTVAPVRCVQVIDGMDNQAPGLNFPVGNLVGATDLDLESIEIITGPSSAMYGPSAFQGVIHMMTKDPWKHPGIDFQIKIGERNLADAQLRLASPIGKNKKFAVKFVGSYMSAQDWIANDDSLNRYGKISPEIDFSSIVQQLKNDPDTAIAYQFQKIVTIFNFYPAGWRGLGKRVVEAPGYLEEELSDHTVSSGKLGLQLSYKFTDDIKLTGLYKFGTGSAIYQGSNRYNIKDIKFHQGKIELAGSNFNVKSYIVSEDAGKSYDIVFTGINMSKHGIEKYVKKYIEAYLNKLISPELSDTFKNGIQEWMADSASKYAHQVASNEWIKPGTPEFDSLFRSITTNPDLQTGSLFVDNSYFWHSEAQYQFNIPKFKSSIISGISYRYYHPRSYGTIFSDTLLDPSQKPPDGSINKKLKYRNIDVWEVGGFLQLRKSFGDFLKVIGSVRVDKHKNFNTQVSPFGGIVVTVGDHIFRASVQTAFRPPTLQNQYLYLDIGPLTLLGNLNGYKNVYTLNSVKDFKNFYEGVHEVNPDLLKKVSYNPIKPENLTTFEIGYRGSPITKFFFDVSAYYNIYNNFIGETRIVIPYGGDTLTDEQAMDAILLGNYKVYQIPVNSRFEVTTYGFSILGSWSTSFFFYNVHKRARITTTATYTTMFADSTMLAQDDIIPGFNAPKHKVTLSLLLEDIADKFGGSFSFIWSDKYMWESPFASGLVPAYYTVNAALNYQFNEYIKIFLGASNLLNKKRIEVYGGPEIGRLIYGGIRVSIKEI